MKKLIILGLVLLMVVSFTAIVLAKADVQKLVPYNYFGDDPAYPDAKGKVIVNEPKGDVVLQITVSVIGLEPDTEYWVKSCTSLVIEDWTEIGPFTTNSNGNGHFHINYREGEQPPPLDIIYIWCAIQSGPGGVPGGIALINEDALP